MLLNLLYSWSPKLGNITVAATKFEDCSKVPQTTSVANFFEKKKNQPVEETSHGVEPNGAELASVQKAASVQLTKSAGGVRSN